MESEGKPKGRVKVFILFSSTVRSQKPSIDVGTKKMRSINIYIFIYLYLE